MSSGKKRRKTDGGKVAGGVNASAAVSGSASPVGGGISATKAIPLLIKAQVMAQVCGRIPPPSPRGFDGEQEQLHNLLKTSICRGESNSVLLIGPRGCGKSLVAARAIASAVSVRSVDDLRWVGLASKKVFTPNMGHSFTLVADQSSCVLSLAVVTGIGLHRGLV